MNSPEEINFGKRFRLIDPDREDLPQLMSELLQEQRSSWRRLREGIDSLAFVRIREVPCNGFTVKLQFNPGRIVSTAAKVDPKSIRERACFLCLQNLPPEQNGILYRDSLAILCNPAPIFIAHYTVSHREHRPQALEPSFAVFLDLARDLSPDYSVFYNGPRCGASAPDHLHFQCGPRNAIPLEAEAADHARRKHLGSQDGVSVIRLAGLGREILVLEGKEKNSLVDVFRKLMSSMRTATRETQEPMINVIASFEDSVWRLIIFLRARHRPAAYSYKGKRRILVSPAAVDMGGLVITPREQDFLSLDSQKLERIFMDVSVLPEVTDVIVSLLEEQGP